MKVNRLLILGIMVSAVTIVFSFIKREKESPLVAPHRISVSEKSNYIEQFRINYNSLKTVNTDFVVNKFKMADAEIFPKEVFETMLNVDCQKIAIHNGVNEKGEVVMILIPYDKNGKAIEENIMEAGQRCPPFCK